MHDTNGAITRRTLLRRAGLVAGAGALAGSSAWRWIAPAAAAEPSLPDAWRPPGSVFRLGVASGDPEPNGVLLWTRLAPDPLAAEPGGGMPAQAARVQWEVAEDENFRRVVRRGNAAARAQFGHSVHVDVRGLSPDRWYWYRFHAFGQTSAVGRTRTAPSPSQVPARLAFAFASCQQWREGFYTAHRALSSEDLDLVVFLGDYIYESSPAGGPRPDVVPAHMLPEPVTLDDYRRRYALYKLDSDLQAAHAAFPWICAFDDHELDNNWADEIPQDPAAQPREQFLARRAAALQAFWENLPMRDFSRPHGIDIRLFRRVEWGRLASLHVLDTRQYRSDQVTTVEAARDPSRSILGDQQERWLLHGLDRSRAQWNVIANQVFMAENDRTVGPAKSYDFDNWDGYQASRRRFTDFLAQRRPANPVVVTGDRHATWACDLTTDFADPAAPIVGAEIVGTSISSGGNADRAIFEAVYGLIKAESPHWKYINNERGYIRGVIDPAAYTADLRVVDTVLAPAATVATRASFLVESDRPGIQLVGA
jgi:alkaline phosphatase D